MLNILAYIAKMIILQILVITLFFTFVVIVYVIKEYLELLKERGKDEK